MSGGDKQISAKDLLQFVKQTVGASINSINTKIDSFATVFGNKTDSLSTSIDTISKKFIAYESHRQHCDSRFSTIDDKFKQEDDKLSRDYDDINDMKRKMKDINYKIDDKVKDVNTKMDIEDKASYKSKNTITWIIGIAAVLITFLSFWSDFHNKDSYLKKEDLRRVILSIDSIYKK